MDKDTLLAQMIENWQALTHALEGVPHEDLEVSGNSGESSVKALCAYLTAWDGEALRRIDIVTGNRFGPLHDPYDENYWETWAKKQVEIKRIMAMQGIMVDMVGTRQRLLSRVAELEDFHFARWLADDPQATQPYYPQCLSQIQAWRAAWDVANPPPTGLKRIWKDFKSKL